jgi:BASS family bile acid:Na+ symporter
MTTAQFFNLLLQSGLFASVLGFASKATAEDVGYLWRRPSLLARALTAIYVAMPLVTLVLVLLPLPRPTKVALVLLAISPGLPVAPKSMLGLGGDPRYVHGLVLSMALIAIVTVPVSLAILSAVFPEEASIRPLQVLKSILPSFLAPLALGIVLRRWAPRAADRIAGPSVKVGQVMLMSWFLILLVLNFRRVLGLGAWSLGALALWTLVGLVVGHLLAGPDPVNRPSLAIANALRHIGVPALIATTSFENANPLPLILAYNLAYTFVPKAYSTWWRKRVAAKAPVAQEPRPSEMIS